jgi:hypothetical protein
MLCLALSPLAHLLVEEILAVPCQLRATLPRQLPRCTFPKKKN